MRNVFYKFFFQPRTSSESFQEFQEEFKNLTKKQILEGKVRGWKNLKKYFVIFWKPKASLHK